VDKLFLLVVFVTTATYRGVFLAGRITIVGVPIGPYDILWFLVFSKALLAVPRQSVALRVSGSRLARSATAFIVAGTLAAVGLAAISGGVPVASLIKLPRLVALLVIPAVAVGRTAIEPRRLLRVVVMGGVVTALLQVLTFVLARGGINIWATLGVTYRDTGLARFVTSSGDIGLIRDPGVSIPFAVLAFLILVVSSALSERVLHRKTLELPMGALCVVGILLSLTRTAYVASAVGVLAMLVLIGAAKTTRLARKAATVATCAVIAVVFVGNSSGDGSDVTEILLARAASIGRAPSRDVSQERRAAESTAALERVNGRTLFGRGDATVLVPRAPGFPATTTDTLHNAYIHYYLAGGLAVLIPILTLMLAMLVSTWRWARQGSGATLVPTSLFAMVVATVAMSFVGGVLDDPFFVPVFGALAGLVLFGEAGGAPCVAKNRRALPKPLMAQ
jgi:hypothetical protein